MDNEGSEAWQLLQVLWIKHDPTLTKSSGRNPVFIVEWIQGTGTSEGCQCCEDYVEFRVESNTMLGALKAMAAKAEEIEKQRGY